MKANGSQIFAAVAGSITALGVVKSVLATVAGGEWSLQKAAFYVAIVSLLMYCVLGAAVTVAGWAAQAGDSDALMIGGLIVGGLVGVALAWNVDLVPYEELGSGGRAYGAALGLIILVVSAYIWNRLRKQEEAQPSPT